MDSRYAIKRCALEAGFDMVGIAPASGLPDFDFAREWQRKGFGGEMRYLANPKRFDPREVLPSVRSVVCVGLIYNTDYAYSTEAEPQGVRSQESEESSRWARTSPLTPDPSPQGRGWSPTRRGPGEGNPRAWISRYAWGRDYHEVLRERLEKLRAAIEALVPEVETRVYVDTGPVIERAFARYSGLGWMGKNTCVLNEQKGSWFFLGVILTNLALEPDLPAPDRCGSCTACLEACPTGALVEPYKMDATRCISYLTIELKGSIPIEFRAAMGNNIFGCDICQDVCPWNRPSPVVRGPLSEAGSSQPSAGDTLKLESGNWELGVRKSNFETRTSRTVSLQRSKFGSRPRAPRPATTEVSDFQPLQLTLKAQTTPASSIQNPKSQIQNPPDTFSLFRPPLAALAAMAEEDFRRDFRHSPIKRAEYRGWLRNLSVAMGNSGDPRFIPWLEEIAAGDDALLREQAEWALDQLRSGPS